MLASARLVAIAPVAGIPIRHELNDGIELERRDSVAWDGTAPAAEPITIRHEIGDTRPAGTRAMLQVPPWCTFLCDASGEPASRFHDVFGEVERLLSCEEPGATYVVRYASEPREPVVALQSELTAFSFALSARGAGLIAHSCAFIAPNGMGVLCPGVSGTGKTTLARLLLEEPGVRVLTDDRAVVTVDADGVVAWGSPWPGAARIASGGHARLSTVVFIRHGAVCGAREVSPRDAFRRVLNTLSMPLWEPSRCGRALEIVDALVTTTRLVEIAFPPTRLGARWVLDVVQHVVSLGRLDVR